MKDALTPPIHQAVSGKKLRNYLLELAQLTFFEHSPHRHLYIYLAGDLGSYNSQFRLAFLT